jgi:formylglycine-generating enzyme required for sulfatase activity
MDKYEVTNAQYKKFIDGEGYSNPSFWIYPMHSNGKELNWKEAMAMFTDRTGRPGPASWEAGSYPDGLEDRPVTGISWYEAAAYATYAGKQLPTIYHWGRVAETSRTQFIVPFSNYNGKSTTRWDPWIQQFGIYDQGNAWEWCFNENNMRTAVYFRRWLK